MGGLENSIRQISPGINQSDLAIAVFLRYYQYDFSEPQLGQIIESIRAYHSAL
jgi:hypothetical protein